MPFSILVQLFATCLVFAATYAVYTATDRLFLSPLTRIPGPKLAALTGWYETFYDVFLPGRYVFRIKKMHEEFGPIIRINPRSVSISDCEFLDTIYQGSRGSKRDKDFQMVEAMGFNSSVGGAWQHDLHRRRRQSLNNFFSQGMVLKFESELLTKVQQLHQIFADAQQNDGIVNLSDVYFAFASDVVSQYVFGHNPNVLSNLSRAHQMRSNVSRALQGSKVNLNFSWMRGIVMSLPQIIGRHPAPPGAIEMSHFRATIRKDIKRVIDEEKLGVGSGANQRSLFRELWNNQDLPPAEKMIPRLEDEATLMIMAGTESPAKSICIAHFYLLQKPLIMRKLRTELDQAGLDTITAVSLPRLFQLPYLNAIAIEANRLSFGLTGRNSRVAHDTLVYTNPDTKKSYSIPPGTPLSASTLLIHTNESIFPDPWSFDPDRWLGDGGSARQKYMLSLGKGTRMCIGTNLANAELLATITEMTRWEMSLWNTTEDDVKFMHDWHVAHPRRDSKGVRAQVTRAI